MFQLDRIYVFAIFAFGCFAALAMVQRQMSDASEEAVARSMRYDVSWTGANGRIEAAHLEKFVARYAALGSSEDAEKAKLFYQILLGRLKIWDTGSFKSFMDLSSDRRAQFQRLRGAIGGLAQDFNRIEYPVAQKKILSVLSEVSPLMDLIGADAHTVATSEAAFIRNKLKEKQRQQDWMIFILIVSGIALLILTVRQNWHLRNANKKIMKNADEMAFLAKHDVLTGLPNRLALEERLRCSNKVQKCDDRIAIFAIDLDGFKAINDVMGHFGGDALLIATSRLLVETASIWNVRNTVYRVGGDEFIIVAHVNEIQSDLIAVANSLATRFKQPIETEYGRVVVDLSIGVAGFSSSRVGLALLKDADLALTSAKVRGRGHVVKFSEGLRKDLHRRTELEGELKKAISNGEIIPHYQPQFDLDSGSVIGFEALARWFHPKLGFIPPSEFIPIAESSGEIVNIGRHLLEIICRDAQQIPAAITMSVNLSVVELLQNDAVNYVAATLAKHNLSPKRLKVEVTESVMMTDLEKVLKNLGALQDLGIAISLDDFGTGYSALCYLTKFKWNELKIDRNFVESALSDPINRAIIRSVQALANKLNAVVVAEGLETVEQEKFLTKIGCNIGQGYLLGKPMPVQEAIALMQRCIDQDITQPDKPQDYGV